MPGGITMLNVVSLEEAKNIIAEKLGTFKSGFEDVGLSEAHSRVLYSDVYAPEALPAFDRSTVDGYALRASDTYGSGESIPAQLQVVGEVFMGEEADMAIGEGECVRISTGGMLPENADSVVMVENTDTSFEEFCLVFKAVSPFENVTRKGDDIKQGDTVLKKGTVISSLHIGVLAGLGITEVKVCRKLRVGIISTGDELIEAEKPLSVGKIRDVNSHILSAAVSEWGCVPRFYGIIKDNYSEILTAVERAVAENDIVLISGGSSAGTKDMTVKVISELGQAHFHGIAMKPGKPTIFGTCGGKAVFGLPGNPAASFYVALLTVRPLIEKIYGSSAKKRTQLCRISTNISSNHGREEIVGVKVEKGIATPVFSKSAYVSVISVCDGYIVVGRNTEGLKQGDEAEVNFF